MAPVIRIDDEVMAKLKEQAIAFNLVFEPPNATLRIILGLDSPANRHPIEERQGRKMLSFVRKAKDLYEMKITDREGFITEVWNGIVGGGKDQRVAEKATKAFLALSEENGQSPVTPKAIRLRAGLHHTASLLWPWLDWNADVIRLEKDESGRRGYAISSSDFHLLRKVIADASDPQGMNQ